MKKQPRDAAVLAVALSYNVADAAAMLGIGQSLVYELIAQGQIPVVRFGQRMVIRRESLERWLQEFEEREIAGLAVPNGHAQKPQTTSALAAQRPGR